MSEALGMDKFSFIGKYTEEKTVDGVIFTKLKHKEDLSCALLDIGKSYCFCFAICFGGVFFGIDGFGAWG